MDEDIKYFEIKLEKLCNIVLQEMGYETILRIHDKLKSERKIPITFNLTERNTKYLANMIANSSENVEAEFFRSLLSTYANLHPSLRERVIKKNLYLELEIAIKENLLIKISHDNKIIDVNILAFKRDSNTGYNCVEATCNKERYIFKIRDIEILKANI